MPRWPWRRLVGPFARLSPLAGAKDPGVCLLPTDEMALTRRRRNNLGSNHFMEAYQLLTFVYYLELKIITSFAMRRLVLQSIL